MKDTRDTICFVRDGVRLVADAAGPVGGVPVVLSHGGGQTRQAWGDTLAALARAGFRGIAVDLRGHGESDWAPEGAYRLHDYADDLREISASINRPAIWVGASLGGLASLLATGEPPQAPALGLVLVDVATRMRPQGVSGITSFMRDTSKGFDSLDQVADAVAAYQPHRVRPRTPERLVKNVRLRGDGRYYWHWDPKMLDSEREVQASDTRLEAAAARVPCPSVLLRGEESALVTAEIAQNFMAHFARGEIIDIRGARHMVAGDENSAFGRELIAIAEAWRSRLVS